MKGKKILACLLAVSLLPMSAHAAGETGKVTEKKQLQIPVETTLAKSELGNPFLGFDENGNTLYGGDPSILVDGDTVYAYVGHDTSTVEWYQMPDYRAYSSKDMIHWKYENKIMDITQVKWALDGVTAWASQVIKFKDKYYLLFCTTSNIPGEKEGHCIGVAECDTPTGNFIPRDQPLILNSQTGFDENWYDIDPTAWIEKDEDGNDETLYISWGNTDAYVCEADADEDGHLYVVDQNKNGIISKADGDIVQFNFKGNPADAGFTEAAYLYRRQDENGRQYGDYYVFYAAGWREQMAYSTTKDLMSGELEFGGIIMPPGTTANTNHEAVFDFKGKSYFVYHSGALPWGSGFRRSACVEEFTFNEDGSIDPIQETSTGVSGTTTQIFDSQGVPVAHEHFVNPLSDAAYPLVKEVMTDADAKSEDATWELEKGKADQNNDAYVSIQSYNKPGLYLCADGTDIFIAQDAKRDDKETGAKMTFRTLKGFAGSGVTFESVAMKGYYLTSQDGDLILSENPSAEACTFQVETDTEASGLDIMKTKRLYTVGSKLDTDDMRVSLVYENGDTKEIKNYKTNADSIDMTSTGKKSLKVMYTEGDTAIEGTVTIRVVEKSQTVADAFGEDPDRIGTAAETSSLVKSFSFEDALDGSTMMTYQNAGTYNGDAVYDQGKKGKAIRLGDYGLKLNVGNIGKEYSVSMWVNPSANLAEHSSLLFSGAPKSAAQNWNSLAGDAVSGNLKYWNSNGSSWVTPASGMALPANTWTLLTLTHSDTEFVIYLNGKQMAKGAALNTLVDDGTDIYIGVNHWDALYKGLVDEIQVYDQALSAGDVQQLYNPRTPQELLEQEGFTVDKSVKTHIGVDKMLNVSLPFGIDASDVSISFQSEDDHIATVDNEGTVTGIALGDTTITTTVKAGNITKTAETAVTVAELYLANLEDTIAEAMALDLDILKSSSTPAFQKALDAVPDDLTSIKTQDEADAYETAIKKAAGQLRYIDHYTDPWDAVEKGMPKEEAEYKTGETETLFAVPEALKKCVSVTYHSDNEAVAAYTDGKVSAKAAGTAVLTATVTSAYDSFPMEYSTCVAVGEKAGTSVAEIFEDVSADSWYVDYVQYVFDKKIMKGMTKTQFGSDVILKRSHFATILYRMEGEPDAEYTDRFQDVPMEQFYTDAVMWASKKDVNIIAGYEDGNFGPDDQITREQMAVMLYRYAKFKGYNVTAASDLKDFDDRGTVSKFAETEVKWAVGAGLIKGDNKKLNPQGTTSRAVCATIIQRFLEAYQ